MSTLDLLHEVNHLMEGYLNGELTLDRMRRLKNILSILEDQVEMDLQKLKGE